MSLTAGVVDWIDLVCIASADDLDDALRNLSREDRDRIKADIIETLQTSTEELELATLRLLIERVRPYALPASVWQRKITDTWSVQNAIAEFLEDRSIKRTPERLSNLQNVYRRFVTSRSRRLHVTEGLLKSQGFRCCVCGYAFSNEDLEDLGIVSPHGNARARRSDRYKPHYASRSRTIPTLDHIFPIALYGSNDRDNLQILCDPCNNGKANYFLFQSKPFVGLPNRKVLSNEILVDNATFYFKLHRDPVCAYTGKTWSESELTVRPARKEVPPVYDNLLTVSYEHIDENEDA